MPVKPIFRLLAVTSLLGAGLSAQAAHAVPAGEASPADPAAEAGLLQYTAGGHALGFTAGGMYAATGDHALHVTFAGANAVQPKADSSAHADGEPAPLGRVVYDNLWDGITLAYSSSGGNIYTTTYSLAPGADPADIRLRYNAPLSVNTDGTLGIAFETGMLTETAPIAWQEIDGRRSAVDAGFQVHGEEVTFSLSGYDPLYPVTIDPGLVWHTFLGGSGTEEGRSIAVDGSGNVFVAGRSSSTWGHPMREYTGATDTFAVKLNSSGALVWNTFLGGSGTDWGYGIAADGNGNVYVAGWSDATWGSPVHTYTGDYDAFAVKLNSSGALVWNTFLGGSGSDTAHDIAVDASGNAFVSGSSDAAWGSPVRAYTGDFDAFAAKLDSSGALAWHTFLGGSLEEYGEEITLDDHGGVFMAGNSYGTWGSPVRGFSAAADAFVVKLNSSGTLVWNTFLGGSGTDAGYGIAAYGSDLYVAGRSNVTWGSPVRVYTGGYDAFAAELNSSGALVWNTFLGGSGFDEGASVAVDRGGNVYMAGYSTATWGIPLRAYAGDNDAFAAKLTSSGALTVNTFLGDSGDDRSYGIAVDGSGTYMAALSNSAWGSPVLPFAGGYDAFAARVNLPHACLLDGLELYDLSGDCQTDVAVYRPSTGKWYIRNQYSLYYGAAGDIPVPGDYNGDGTTDIAVFRPATGAWYIRNQFTAYFGQSGDIPVPGDYNADGTTEIAVYRPATGAWYVRGQATVYYGASTDIPVPGDYTGDGTTDIAVYRPSTGAWYIRGLATEYYGVSTDIPVPGDYDGSGTTDIAVFRPSTGAWYIRGQSSAYYGTATDIAVPGDYDGNGVTDIAVFRPSTGAWYIRNQYSAFYGASGDIPLPEMGTGKAGAAP
jgi:hypothetical protein